MNSAFAFVVIVVGFFAISVLAFRAIAQHSQKVRRQFTDLASRLGLTAAPAQPKFGLFSPECEATGLLRGKSARLYSYSTGSGKSRTTWTALGVRPRELGGLTFSISPQGLGSKVAELFGAREITVGDPAFDKAWFIQTNQPEFLAAALLPELRARLTAAFADRPHALQPSLTLERDIVVYAEKGDFGSEIRCERLARVAEVLCDFADIAEVHAQHTQPG